MKRVRYVYGLVFLHDLLKLPVKRVRLIERKTQVKIAHVVFGGVNTVPLRRISEIESARRHAVSCAVYSIIRLAVVHVAYLETELFMFGKSHVRAAEPFADLYQREVFEPHRLDKIFVVDMETFDVGNVFHICIIPRNSAYFKKILKFVI